MRKFLCISMVLMLMSLHVWAQRTVTGRVTDDKGAPLSNVSVTVKNSTTGTVTGEDGSFSINVPANGRTLVFSFADMSTREVAVGNQSTVNVSLAPMERSLQEVVVVGYGTQRRTEITGNVAQISGAKLRDQPVQTFEQGLSGRAAGVNINIPNGVLGNPPVIRVRGVNSISLSSYPLVVIDGVPSFTGDAGGTASNNLLGDINPADIESIEILKDASAAAIYGSRASAGVLLITTKRGRAGRTRVNYEGWAGWTKPYNLIPVLNAQEFTDLKNEGLTNAGLPPNGTNRGFYTMNDANGNLVDTRWYDYIFRTGFAQNHSLSISGANEKTNYYFSTGYTKQEGMFRNNNYDRMSGRFTLDHSVNTWLKVGGTFNYTNSDNEGLNTGSTGGAFNTSGGARLAFVLAPNVSPYNADGSYNINGTSSIGQGANKSVLAFTNPVLLLDLNKFTSESERIMGNVYGNIRLFEGLNFKSLYGVDNLTVVNNEFRTGIHGDGAQFGGAASSIVSQPRRWNWQNTLDYSTRLASNHGINLLVGAEQQYTTSRSFGADRRKVSDPFFNEFQGGFSEIVPSGLGLGENFLQSYFGRLNYDFKRKYFLSANVRRDGYSAFANKWGTFYGGSAGWTVSEEDFWKDASFNSVFSTLRLRGSYGMVGNFAGVGNYTYQSTFGSGLYGTQPTLVFNNAGNENLTWETSNKLDAGFVAGFFRDRLNLEFAYYKNDINNLILAEPQAPSRGIPGNSILTNIGSMQNQGIELTLSGTVLSRRDFTWNANFNFTTVNNEVTKLANNNADILVATGGLESVSMIRVGESIGSFYVVKTEGINPANGRRIFVLRDGTRVQFDLSAPTQAQRWTKVTDGTVSRAASQAADGVLMGPALPKYFGGLDNSFRFKGIDLNILLYYSGGNYVYNGTKAGLHDNRNWNNAKDAMNRWTKPGDDAEWPRVVFGDNISNGSAIPISNSVEKGDFVKVRNISLGYSVPRNLVERLNINNIRVYVAALNPFTFAGYSGFDPEIQTNGNSNGAPSVDRNSAPLARTVNVGINVGF